MSNIRVVTGIRYKENEEKKYISELLVSHMIKDENDELEDGAFINSSMPKDIVILEIDSAIVPYYTGINSSKNIKLGAKIQVVEIDEEKYLKTEPNDIKEDNLGELPEY